MCTQRRERLTERGGSPGIAKPHAVEPTIVNETAVVNIQAPGETDFGQQQRRQTGGQLQRDQLQQRSQADLRGELR